MSLTPREAQQLASRKFGEAQQWWESFQAAVDQYRCWGIVWFARRRRWVAYLRRGRYGDLYLDEMAKLQAATEEAHDRMLVAADAMFNAARCASASEIAARIYYEEYEGREADKPVV